MRKREALVAMAEGKKVKLPHWEDGYLFMNLTNGRICMEDGEYYQYFKNIEQDEEFEIYEEPRKKVMVYPALYKDKAGICYIPARLFPDEATAKEYCGMGEFVRLLLDRGVEVEG